jgi:nicotinate-nucleotide adenylyltransferase
MKIGLFGGSFDPIHIGHLIIANFSLEEFGLDKVFFIPANASPFKTEYLFSPACRLEMVRLAVKDNEKFEVSDFEITKGGVSYTITTIEYFENLLPGSQIFLIVGQDSAESLHLWKDSKKIVEKVNVVVYPRIINGEFRKFKVPEPLKEYKDKFHILNTPYVDISSTLIRERLRSRKSIRYLVPKEVLDYISKHFVDSYF